MKVQTRKINQKEFLRLAGRVAGVIKASNPTADYDWETASKEYQTCVDMTIEENRLNKSNLQDILWAREHFEASIKKQYGAKISTGDINSINYDHQQALTQAGVPQELRIASGFLDGLIGQLMC